MSVEHNEMIYFMLNSTIIIIIAHRTLLSVIWQPGWKESSGRMDTHICIAECLLCSPAITTLLIGYQFSSVIQLCLTLCDPMDWSTPGLPVHHQFPELAQTHVHWVGDAIQPSHPFLSPSALPSVFPSIRVFSNLSVLRIRWPKYWSFSFSVSPSNEYSGLISFRIDWFDLLAVQGTLKSLLQHHSSKASIIQCSAFL